MGDRTAARLLRLLKDEREAILSGAYDRLGPIAPRKETLLTKLAPSDPALPSVAAAVTRNQALLEAAMRGLAAGRDAIAERKAGPKLTTYSADGSTSEAAGSPGSEPLDRRA